MKNLGLVFTRTNDELACVDLHEADQPQAFSCSALQQLADGVASNLDIERGARVGILAWNSIEYVAILLGIMRAGGVAVPINHKFPDSTVHYIVGDAALSIVFADEENRMRLPSNVDVRDMSCAYSSGYDAIEPHDGEPGLILYTSGSTGRPKGVVLSHDSQLSMVERVGTGLRGRVAIVAAPLYHMNALLILFMYLYSGGGIVLLPRFDARTYLRAIETYQVNAITGVPTMLALMLRENDLIETLDFSSVTAISIGSAPLSATVASRAMAVFPNASITNGYGTTEAGALIFGSHPQGLATPSVALGYPQPHVQVRLVDGESARDGVLEVKTAAVMNEYLNLPEKTAEKTSKDGWINTGDTMRVDENGFYFFVGRDDDMFNCSGENIFPGEVERILESDPRIAECCVVPLSDEIRGHIPIAFVIVEHSAKLNEQQVKDVVLANAPAYMHPRHVVFIKAMPLAGTNKIDRKVLAELATATIIRPD